MSRVPRRRLRLAALAGAALLVASCAGPDREPEEVGCGGLELSAPARDRSVVVVVGDTLRRSTPGAYGGSAKTPTLDHVARFPLPGEARNMVKRYARYPDGGTPESDGILPSLALLELSYRKGVERFDAALGAFLAGLRARRNRDSYALIVTSDHGESLYAHGIGNHGTSLYQDEVAIPLVMQLPGVSPAPARSRCPVSLVDVMPVLCRYSGLACPADPAGGDAIFRGARRPRLTWWWKA